MDDAEAARRSVYLLFAARAGRLAKQNWQGWADRLIEAGMVDDWIIDISIARTIDELSSGRASPLQPVIDSDVILGHLWIRFRCAEISLKEFLEKAATEADRYQTSLDNALFNAEGICLRSGTPPSIVIRRFDSLLAPLVDEAERQWKELFPER